jgi:hypothetical protein
MTVPLTPGPSRSGGNQHHQRDGVEAVPPSARDDLRGGQAAVARLGRHRPLAGRLAVVTWPQVSPGIRLGACAELG